MAMSLHDYGFLPFFARQTSLEELDCNRVARVTGLLRSELIVFDGDAERSVALTPARHDAAPERRPTVGDWIVLDEQRSRVERVLERKSLFRRVAAGGNNEIQLIAANTDILFVVTSCNDEFRESRLERYLALAVEAGVMPVVVLTKADLTDTADAYVERVRRVRPDVPVECVNALDESSLAGLTAWIEPGTTIALVGSSGVGKSTLLNTLSTRQRAATNEIRESDSKGRHTTSHRALYRLPGGGLLIDAPGMRELKVAGVRDALASVFDDIEAVASDCRFSDCHHENEPGCAVRRAVETGDIDARRLRNYLKLKREDERNSASLAEKRSQGRAFARHVKQVKARKQADRNRR